MLMQEQQERREYPRLMLNRLVLVKEESGNTVQLVGVNYSARGMALNGTYHLSFGDFVELQFWLTEPENKEVKITAEVVQNAKRGDICISNLKFVGELQLN